MLSHRLFTKENLFAIVVVVMVMGMGIVGDVNFLSILFLHYLFLIVGSAVVVAACFQFFLCRLCLVPRNNEIIWT